ncbi:hypothetical protein BDV96DRAFT_662412 [Lophiotrema nucula]|uniref:Uncharacterized protein n=1 Tax=Lophiotrema nucula TaxID=690887 RepID=A0A6A5Z2S2_9PLEO|nr:hypothetical protein BDV96DRAFT_662412 [Lophiotrema nucula]
MLDKFERELLETMKKNEQQRIDTQRAVIQEAEATRKKKIGEVEVSQGEIITKALQIIDEARQNMVRLVSIENKAANSDIEYGVPGLLDETFPHQRAGLETVSDSSTRALISASKPTCIRPESGITSKRNTIDWLEKTNFEAGLLGFTSPPRALKRFRKNPGKANDGEANDPILPTQDTGYGTPLHSLEQAETLIRRQPEANTGLESAALRGIKSAIRGSDASGIKAMPNPTKKPTKATSLRPNPLPKIQKARPTTEKAESLRSKRPTAGEAKPNLRPRSKLTKVISLSSSSESEPETRGHMSLRAERSSMHDVGRMQKDKDLPCKLRLHYLFIDASLVLLQEPCIASDILITSLL